MNRLLAVTAVIALSGCGTGAGERATSPTDRTAASTDTSASTPADTGAGPAPETTDAFVSTSTAGTEPTQHTTHTVPATVQATTPATVPITVPVTAPVTVPATVPATLPPTFANLPVPYIHVSLNTGACYNVGADNVAVILKCDQPHFGESFRSHVALTDISSTETDPLRWLFATAAACGTYFENFTGAALGVLDFTIAAVVTSDPGDPVVISCTTTKLDGSLWTGSAERIVGAYSGIDVGDCFDFPTADAPATLRACGSSHDAEMFVVEAPLGPDQLAPGAPYPTSKEWGALARTICEAPFEAYTGQSVRRSTELSYSYIYTLERNWDDVNLRHMSCAVVNDDGTPLIGSVRA
ncbi:unannotated protein [freshwater metagenome]|uniref:Unannotated protein n=1 Tax=freshwater metagenome TaxID=449393 RepID=A0A6J7F4W1_9ZZZZ